MVMDRKTGSRRVFLFDSGLAWRKLGTREKGGGGDFGLTHLMIILAARVDGRGLE